MIIGSIKNGMVIDHITAGRAMELYDLLGLEKADCEVALIKNAVSAKMGRKDIIKINGDFPVDLNVIAYHCSDLLSVGLDLLSVELYRYKGFVAFHV